MARVQTSAQIDTTEFQAYLDDISRFELLTHEQEIAFAQHKNYEQLVTHNLRLVISIARSYSRFCDVPIMDLIQEGNIGLMKAAEKFDVSKINPQNGLPFKFSTYATWWIKQAIMRYINEHGHSAIRVPSYIAERAKRLKRSGVSLEELDEEMRHVLHIMESFASLDAEMDDDGMTLSELIEDRNAAVPVDELSKAELADIVEEALEVLNKRTRAILKMRFGLGTHERNTLEEIAGEFNITKERVRQLEYRGLHTLSHNRELAAL